MNSVFKILLVIFVFTSCQNSQNQSDYTLFLGTYTDGDSKGIYKVEMNADGKMEMIGLAAETKNPSFLAFANNQSTLLAVNEISLDNNMGTVESYQIKDSLKLISRKPSGGAHPCFVAANDKGDVLMANYSGGNIGYLNIDKDGVLSELLDVQQHLGIGQYTNDQNKSHAHSVLFQPNSEQIVAVDLGINELWISRIDKSQKKFIGDSPKRIQLSDGAGPRHMCFHPSRHYAFVINELDNTISSFKIIEEDFKLIANSTTVPKDFSDKSYTADIHISKDGKFLYGSNRGHNSIVIFEVGDKAELKLVGHESTRGDFPRNFNLSPDGKFLIVANQKSNNLVCFSRNHETGTLTFVDEIEAPSPVCILFKN